MLKEGLSVVGSEVTSGDTGGGGGKMDAWPAISARLCRYLVQCHQITASDRLYLSFLNGREKLQI